MTIEYKRDGYTDYATTNIDMEGKVNSINLHTPYIYDDYIHPVVEGVALTKDLTKEDLESLLELFDSF